MRVRVRVRVAVRVGMRMRMLVLMSVAIFVSVRVCEARRMVGQQPGREAIIAMFGGVLRVSRGQVNGRVQSTSTAEIKALLPVFPQAQVCSRELHPGCAQLVQREHRLLQGGENVRFCGEFCVETQGDLDFLRVLLRQSHATKKFCIGKGIHRLCDKR